MQRAIWFFPVGVLIGAALAWVFLVGLADSPDVMTPGSMPRPTPVAPGSSPSPDAPDAPDAPALERSTGDSDLHQFAVAPRLAVTYWSSLAVADAIAGRIDRFLEDARKLLEAGGDPEEIQEMLAYLPGESAAGVMEKLIEAYPDRSWDRSALADLYVEADQPELAFTTLLAGLRAAEEDPESGITRLVGIDPVRAGSALLMLAKDLEWDGYMLIHCAEELVDADQPTLAGPFLLKALEGDPADEDGIDLMSRIDPSLAANLAENAVRAAPEDTDAWARLARIRRESGDLAGAFLAYRRAAVVAADGDNRLDMMRGMIRTNPMEALPVIRNLAEGEDDEMLGVLGQAYVAAGQRDAAFRVFDQAHQVDPSDSEWLHRMVSLDPVRASEDFKLKIADSPGSGNDELFGTYALSLERQGRLSEAYDAYLRAWTMDEDDWEWMRGLARTNPKRAGDLLLGKHRDNPEDATVAGALADAYAGMGRTAEAVRLYQQAIEAGEERHRWMAALAALEPARGLPMLRAAVEEDPDDDEYWGALGDAYFGLGRMTEARDAYDRALEIDPSDWEWSIQRARIP